MSSIEYSKFQKNKQHKKTMIRKIHISIFIVFLMFFSCSTTTEKKILRTFVFDNENIFTKLQIRELDSLISAHEKITTNEIAILTTSDFGKSDNILYYSFDFYNRYGIGKKDYDNGVLIVLSTVKKQCRITTGYGTEEVLKDEIAKKIIDSLMTPKFKEQKYFEGVRDGCTAIITFLEKPENKIKLRQKKR